LKSYHSRVSVYQGLRDPVFFAIVDKESGRSVGVASYQWIHPEEGSIEVGYIHFSPHLQRSTAATESMFLMMQWAFEAGYRRYEWKFNALNQASWRAAQRLGLSFEGIIRQMMIIKGRNCDTAWLATINTEWPALRTVFKSYFDDRNFYKKGQPINSLTSLTSPLLYKVDV
jgi:RimJ/RimL family protein N-acetyltransferase